MKVLQQRRRDSTALIALGRMVVTVSTLKFLEYQILSDQGEKKCLAVLN